MLSHISSITHYLPLNFSHISVKFCPSFFALILSQALQSTECETKSLHLQQSKSVVSRSLKPTSALASPSQIPISISNSFILSPKLLVTHKGYHGF